MGRTSAKNRYTQLIEWLGTRKQSQVKTGKVKSETRLEHYKKKGA